MHRRSLIFVMVAVLLLACRFTSEEKVSPTATAIPATTDINVPVTQTLDIPLVTPAPETGTILALDWLSQLNIINAGNWSRLQLLKTFPAEMPLNHSAVAISVDGKMMAVGSSGGARIHFFELPSWQSSSTVVVSGVLDADAYFDVIEYLPDGTIMANTSSPYMIYHIDDKGNVLAAWDSGNFAISTDKKILAHMDIEGIVLVEIANNNPLVSLEDGSGLAFSFSPDGSKIAAEDVGVDYIHTAIWDIANKTVLTTLDEMASPRFSPDGKFLAVTKYDYENDTTPLKILSPDGTTEITSLNVGGPNDLSNRASLWSVDGSLIAAQIANGSPVAWNTANWQLLEAPALRGDLYAFSPDGRILITRASDGAILLWGVLH